MMTQNKNFSFLTLFILLLASCFLLPVSLHAAVPRLLTYHGILKNSSGSFLSGSYSMTFKIYTLSTGGAASWTETQSTVSVSSGRFSVELGSVTEMNLSFNQDYWLGITVGADPEMTPRIRLTSAGYSLMAEDVTGGKLTGSQHASDSHMSIEGVRSAHTNMAKTNFKLDAYTQASANSMGDLIVDSFNDATGIDASNSSDYTWRGSPNYDLIAGAQGGIDTNTVLMLHGNGTDGSSAFTDSSSGSKSVTAVGNAQIDTAQTKFGTASGLFDGIGDYLSLADHADFDFGTGDFTIDFWVRFSMISATVFMGHSTAAGEFAFGMDGANRLWTYLGSSSYYRNWGTWSPSTGVWYHLALVRSGSDVRVFIDGVQFGTTYTNSQSLNSSAGVTIGAYNTPEQYLYGSLDEFRISKGVSRWTSNFTPPTSEYTAPGGATATVISIPFTEPAPFNEAIVIASHSLGTGSIIYYLSRNNGTNWTQCTNEQVCSLSAQPSGSQLRWKASISGNAELDAIGVAV